MQSVHDVVTQLLELVEADPGHDVLAHHAGGDELLAVLHGGGTEGETGQEDQVKIGLANSRVMS